MAESREKIELIAQLDAARAEGSRHVELLRRQKRPDVQLRDTVRENVQGAIGRHRWAYLGGAALVGLILAKLPARKKQVVVDTRGRKAKVEKEAAAAVGMTGLLLAGLKFAFDMFRPLCLHLWPQHAGRSRVLAGRAHLIFFFARSFASAPCPFPSSPGHASAIPNRNRSNLLIPVTYG